MWGTGARDDYTIASCVARHLAEVGVYADVVNFGESGYVSKQELIALLGELEKGNIPDLVVCLDGVNDTWTAFQNRVAGLPQNEFNRSREFNTHSMARKATCGEIARHCFPGILRVAAGIMRRVAGNRVPAESAGELSWQDMRQTDDNLLADDVVNRYRSAIDTIKVLSEAHGFQVLFYWQPTVFRKQSRSPDELSYAHDSEALFKRVYNRIGNDPTLAKNTNFHNLADIVADQTEPLFIDFCHMAEKGNDLIARRMIADIRSALRKQ
jgi:hypothetical protein